MGDGSGSQMQTNYVGRIRLGAISIAVSSFLFAAFPLVRPFSDRSSIQLEVAETLASSAWFVSHILAIIAFILLPLGGMWIAGSILQRIREPIRDSNILSE